MMTSISNSKLTVTVKGRGAELCSIRSAGGIEYMWQADPDVWPRHAPILFPIVGKLANDRYSFEGKSYELGQHGFARDMDFEPVLQTSETLSYRLCPSDETRKKYPFEFELWVKFSLHASSLGVCYEVRNCGRGVMPFSIGAHPAFALAWGAGDMLEDYYLEFEKEETLDSHFLGAGSLLCGDTARILEDERTIPIRKDMFNRDALIFMDVKSDRISLCSTKHSNRLTVDYPGFPYLGIWAKPGAAFVCIEPWYGHVDPVGSDGLIMNKPGIINLPAGGLFTCTHMVGLEE